MPSTTPLHEPYCPFVREPVSQGDVIEGLAQLATAGVVEVTDLIETLHREIVLRPLGLHTPENIERWHYGITGRVYGLIRQLMQAYGKNMATSLRLINKKLGREQQRRMLPDPIKMVVNALNGVMGDHLVHQGNPLSLSMILYDRYGQPQRGELTGRVVILVHGLCMSYLSWHPGQNMGLGESILYTMPDTTVVYLDYNTGRRISQNGRSFSRLLEELVERNPGITEIDLIGHSMGGLVSRSALFYGKQDCMQWVSTIDHLICIGSPHHGAVLERIGFFLHDILAKLPFAGSLAHLLDLRSAGIIDLRHGSIRDDDWEHLQGRLGMPEDYRRPAPLPSTVKAFLIAGSIDTEPKNNFAASFIGDGLVTVDSALGEHEGDHTLNVPEGHKAIFYGINHMELQYDERVREQVIQWLTKTNQAHALKPRIISMEHPELQLAG